MRYYLFSLCALIVFSTIIGQFMITYQKEILANSVVDTVTNLPKGHYIYKYNTSTVDTIQHTQVYKVTTYFEATSYILFNHVLVPMGGKTGQRLQQIYSHYRINLNSDNKLIQTKMEHYYLFTPDLYVDAPISTLTETLGLVFDWQVQPPETVIAKTLVTPPQLYFYGHTSASGTFCVEAVSDDLSILISIVISSYIIILALFVTSCILILGCVHRTYYFS